MIWLVIYNCKMLKKSGIYIRKFPAKFRNFTTLKRSWRKSAPASRKATHNYLTLND